MPHDNIQFPLSSATATRLLLGIDGGGTKTTATLAVHRDDGQPEEIGRGASGPSNPRAVGWEAAWQNIDNAVAAAFATAGRARQRVAAMCLALAGAGHVSVREPMRQWCGEQGLAEHWRVAHDAQIVVRAGTPQGQGIALIAGTGSLAFGQTLAGRSARAGGWGYLLGDEGSGYAVGLAALRAIARSTDGRGPDTKLTPMVLTDWNLDGPWELLPALHEHPEAQRRIAALAPKVCAIAQEGDSVALRIRECVVEDLSSLVLTVAHALDFSHLTYELALAGGLLQHQPVLCDGLHQRLADHRMAPRASIVVADPVQGAVLLANDLLA